MQHKDSTGSHQDCPAMTQLGQTTELHFSLRVSSIKLSFFEGEKNSYLILTADNLGTIIPPKPPISMRPAANHFISLHKESKTV